MKLIETEGIKYIGSKERLLPYILDFVQRLRPRVVLDGFSGTTRVSQALARLGYVVIANDVAEWSKVFAQCYLLNKKSSDYYQRVIDHLNNLPGKYGWFSENYGGDPRNGGPKRPWQVHNTMKLDAIREEIDKVAGDEIEKAVLLTSLILALDKVDNTVGHYVSYLRGWSRRSFRTMRLEVPRLIWSDKSHKVYQKDIFEILPEVEVDLAYLDPPYGSNNDKMPAARVRYQAYYHIWTTVIKNDRPLLFGSANRRLDSSDKMNYSPFEDFRKNGRGEFVALDAIRRLIRNVRAKFVLFSYSSNGRVSFGELMDVFCENAEVVEVCAVDYRLNVMGSMRWTNEWVRENAGNKEFLFLLRM